MITHHSVHIGVHRLPGDLALVPDAIGVVLFAHGSGSSRQSPRNRQVAEALQRRRLATVLLDLLAPEEAEDRRTVFDIAPLPIGLFGASTGAAAALQAAAAHPGVVRAVVSRGGRPDLAAADLPQVLAPTLLILGGEDRLLLPLHRDALQQLRCAKHLAIVPGATHLFEEPGTLESVGWLAACWFADHLGSTGPSAAG